MKKQTIVVISVVAALLIVALALGIGVSCLMGKDAVLSYKGSHITKDVYAYWQLRFSHSYRAVYGEGAADTAAFWNAPSHQEGKTHQEACEDYIQTMVGQIVASAYLFDASGGRLTAAQNAAIEKAVETATGGYRFDGDPEGYETLSREYGFDRKSVETALVYELKANLMEANAEADSLQILSYYNREYVRVRILYINTFCKYVIDSETGERVPSDTGEDLYILLTPEEVEEKEAAYRAVMEEMSAFSGLTDEEKEKKFENLMKSYNEDTGVKQLGSGYYFAKDAAYTQAYGETLEDVVEAAFSLENRGDYTVVNNKWGYHIVYRYELDGDALQNAGDNPCFTDLEEDASLWYFREWRDSKIPDIRWKTVPPMVTSKGKSDAYLLIVNPPPPV